MKGRFAARDRNAAITSRERAGLSLRNELHVRKVADAFAETRAPPVVDYDDLEAIRRPGLGLQRPQAGLQAPVVAVHGDDHRDEGLLR